MIFLEIRADVMRGSVGRTRNAMVRVRHGLMRPAA
jgi:hypothetical protein